MLCRAPHFLCLLILLALTAVYTFAVAEEDIPQKADTFSDVSVKQAPGEKTLSRRYDPIVVPGDLVPLFDGLPIENFRLYAYDSAQLSVIPFQIDERDPEGEFVLAGGKMAGADADSGLFDYNDEVVFLAKDVGGRAPRSAWEWMGTRRAELVVSDPRDPSQKGWVYLVYHAGTLPPLSSVDYVRYTPGEEIVQSDYYSLKYKKGAPFYMNIVYPKAVGGNGEDFFDRVKVRLTVTAFFRLIEIQKTEEDFRSEVVGWKDGPVRVLRRVENYFRILFNLSSPSIFSVNEYYERLTYTPVQLTIPFRLKWVFHSFGINDWTWRVYGDFPGLKGGMAYTDRNLQGFRFTGNTDQQTIEENIDTSRFTWGYNTKKGVGTWFPNLLLPEMLYGIVTLYVVDDENWLDPPEDTPGVIGGGMKGCWQEFNPELMKRLEPGTYELSLDTYFPHPTIQIDEVEEWLQIRRNPLWIEVGATSSDGTSGELRLTTETWAENRRENEEEGENFFGVLTDTRGRRLELHRIYFYAGSYRVTPRTTILGRFFSEERYELYPFQEIKRLENRFEPVDPVSEMKDPMVQRMVLRNGEVVDLLGCKPCGFTGRLPDGKKIFLWNTQIRSIAFE